MVVLAGDIARGVAEGPGVVEVGLVQMTMEEPGQPVSSFSFWAMKAIISSQPGK